MPPLKPLLFVTAEAHPASRPDVAVLFGQQLSSLGVRTDIVALSPHGADQPAPWPGGVARLRASPSSMALRHLAALHHAVREMLAANRQHHAAIQVRDLPLPAAVGLLIARLKGLPFFYWMSYPMPEGQTALARERGMQAGFARWLFPWLRGRVGRWLLEKLVLPRADHVFVQSEPMRAALGARGHDMLRMTPVPMGVDLQAVARTSAERLDDARVEGRELLVYLGSLDRPRRLEGLLAMMVELLPRRPKLMLAMVGDTEDIPQRDALHRECERLGLGAHVLWTGWLPADVAWRWVRAARVALSPIPRGELLDVSSPTKLPEYMALGVPVVCNDNPDQAAVVAQSGAGRCVTYTPQNFAAAVEELLDLPDADRAAMVQRGQRWVAQHRDYAVLGRQLAARYGELLAPQMNLDRRMT